MNDRHRNSRKLLLDAAIAEFAESGYAGARTDRIAGEAGVNKQLIFYYFRSKSGLYDAVLEDARRRLSAARGDAGGGGRGPDALREQLRALFDVLSNEPSLTRLIFRGLRESGPAGAAARAAVAALVDQFATLISDGQGTGYFRDDMDPTLAARQAVVLSLGYLGMSGAFGQTDRRADGQAGGKSPSGGRHGHLASNGGDEVGHDAWLQGASQLLVRSLTW